MTQSRNTLSLFSLIILASTAACSVDSVPSDDEPLPPDHAGTWVGQTDDGGQVTITVDEGEVVGDVEVDLTLHLGTGSCQGIFVARLDAPLVDGAFAHEGMLENPGGVVRGHIDAAFSGDIAHGGYDYDSYSVVCGGYFIVGSGGGASGTFTLSRVDGGGAE